MKSPTLTLPLYAKFAFILLSLSIITVTLFYGQSILIPLVLALLFSILLRPVEVFLNKKFKFPRVIAALTSVILAIIVISAIILFISWQVSDITDDWVKIKHNFSIHYERLQHWVSQRYHVSYNKQQSYINQVAQGTLTGDSELIGNTLNSFTGTLLNMVLIPIYTFLMLLYRELFIQFLSKIVHKKNEHTLAEILTQVKTVVQRYIVGLLIEMGIVGILTTVGLMILGVQYAVLLGAITAILNLVPYIGILAAGIISIIATLGNSTDVSLMLGIIITNAVVQLIDNNVVAPNIVGNNVRINALATMVGVIAGGVIWGIPGMILSIPLTAIIKVIFDHIEPLKPWGFLLGNNAPTSPGLSIIKLKK
ncbi:MAG: AI-2E family transporter [Bacteroidota bacterium]|nr:AI-2E family transporter [Bacteroidota bacterium]